VELTPQVQDLPKPVVNVMNQKFEIEVAEHGGNYVMQCTLANM
jgi:hypothetical protein